MRFLKVKADTQCIFVKYVAMSFRNSVECNRMLKNSGFHFPPKAESCGGSFKNALTAPQIFSRTHFPLASLACACRLVISSFCSTSPSTSVFHAVGRRRQEDPF